MMSSSSGGREISPGRGTVVSVDGLAVRSTNDLDDGATAWMSGVLIMSKGAHRGAQATCAELANAGLDLHRRSAAQPG
ncbi:hypothetical protein BE17_42550 [Sorangium cellulosum]|uniref:Uncharacterized protein n=1 Tax=Sorangium cellulosum TaxID=56 RepID=A0A150SNY8_SORCE|nr:hypothetical protein BE17_42550 [Sorangium cellulosum]